MSYGVTVKFKYSKDKQPWMDVNDVVKIHDTFDLPESNFVYEVYKEAMARITTKVACSKCKTKNDADAKHCKNCGGALNPITSSSNRIDLPENRLWWSGNHASDSFESVAPFIHGRLEAFFVGEDGEVFGGAIIEDGKYIKCSVEMTLVPE